jgi:hypothetical protein
VLRTSGLQKYFVSGLKVVILGGLVKDKAERMRSRAHAKLVKKLASARRQAEELQAEAEAHRADATAKTTKRAEIMKTTGKFPSLLFFNLLCT